MSAPSTCLEDSHPWELAHRDFEDVVLPRLRRHGKRIGEAGSAGDAKAIAIMRWYSQLGRSFDPMTLVLLKEALAAWEANDTQPQPQKDTP